MPRLRVRLGARSSPDSAKITFAELDQQGRSVAGWVAQNSARGDRVGIVEDNS
jgi:long-subunit acyl-CoA synthetase (AMP-forming)